MSAANSDSDLGALFDGHIAREFAHFDVDAVSAGLKRSHSRRSLVSHLAPELTSVHTSTRER